MNPEEIISRLLHRDGMMLILDKPAGLPVHKGPKGGENLEESFEHLKFGLPRRPALAHRLDRDTSGCLVLGRHRKALERLMKLFKAGAIDKTYWAGVEGGPEAGDGPIDIPLGPPDAPRCWGKKDDPAGLPSQTRWRVLGRGADEAGKPLAWLALEPLTGRTHQLRVHCATSGFPILGDPIYGSGGAMPLHLHAREIVVPMAKNGPPTKATAPIPTHMQAMLERCGWDGEAPSLTLPRSAGEGEDSQRG